MRLSRALSAALAAALLTLTSMQPAGATASPAPSTAAASPDAAASYVVPASQANLAEYWTTERMTAATSEPDPVLPSATPSNAPKSTATKSAPGRTPPLFTPKPELLALTHFSRSKYWEGHGQMPAVSIGKLYYTDSAGADHWCSASVITAANDSVVWTAGHCVNNGSGVWSRNVLFAPDYHDGLWPLGTWAASVLYAPNGYIDGKSHDYDMGAVRLAPNARGRVAAVTGSQGYRFGGNQVWQDVRTFGYPGNTHPTRSDINPAGHSLMFCVGNATPLSLIQRIDCDMGGGSSGGPFLYDLQLGRGWGYIVGHNAWHSDPGLPIEYSPQLLDAAINVHTAAEGS
jgi:hypothetical protein